MRERAKYRFPLATLLAGFVMVLTPSLANAAQGTDGSGDYWEIDAPNVPSQTITVACWIYRSADYQTIFAYGDGSARGFQVYYDGAVKIRAHNGATGDGTTALSTATWYHIAVTYNTSGFNTTVYVDGVDDTADNNFAFTSPSSTDDIRIAKAYVNDAAGVSDWNGRLADCAYWNGTVLSSGDIADLAAGTTRPDDYPTGLQVYTALTSGVAVTDSSSNAFTVTENGTPTDQDDPPEIAGGGATNHLFLQAGDY